MATADVKNDSDMSKAPSYDPGLDARHVAVDAYMSSHLVEREHDEDYTKLEKIRQYSLEAGLPDMAVSRLQAKMLMLFVRMSRSRHVLEIGTLGGYSAAWLASAGKDVKVTSIELNPDYAALAKANIATADLSQRIRVITGAALDVLPTLLEEVRDGSRPKFDFVFIDANKQDNLAYFKLALELTTPSATIVVDNVVRDGKVASFDEAEKDDRVKGVRQLVEYIGSSQAVDASVLQTVGEKGYDGFLLAVKK